MSHWETLQVMLRSSQQYQVQGLLSQPLFGVSVKAQSQDEGSKPLLPMVAPPPCCHCATVPPCPELLLRDPWMNVNINACHYFCTVQELTASADTDFLSWTMCTLSTLN